LIPLFKTECHYCSEEIDEYNEEDWRSLTIGWAIAKGLSPKEARDFARHIKYDTQLG